MHSLIILTICLVLFQANTIPTIEQASITSSENIDSVQAFNTKLLSYYKEIYANPALQPSSSFVDRPDTCVVVRQSFRSDKALECHSIDLIVLDHKQFDAFVFQILSPTGYFAYRPVIVYGSDHLNELEVIRGFDHISCNSQIEAVELVLVFLGCRQNNDWDAP